MHPSALCISDSFFEDFVLSFSASYTVGMMTGSASSLSETCPSCP